MGFFDKVKKGLKAVTGGAAKVTIEWEPKVVAPGQEMAVKVCVQSTGDEVKSKGVFVDFYGVETFLAPPEPVKETVASTSGAAGSKSEGASAENDPVGELTAEEREPKEPETDTRRVCDKVFTLSESFVLGANESKEFAGRIKIPESLPPSSNEELGCHDRIRGRLEAFGNDPDSGYKAITVTAIPGPQSSEI